MRHTALVQDVDRVALPPSLIASASKSQTMIKTFNNVISLLYLPLLIFFRMWSCKKEPSRRMRWNSRSLTVASWEYNRARSAAVRPWNACMFREFTAWSPKGKPFRISAHITRILRCRSATACSWKVTPFGTCAARWASRYHDVNMWR